ncbi:hypothetical protein HY090_03215 [Candidatus Kaiserbacteria bacterium]|nr:hypothetical protein [Candidatus Kaiserbacteria bacterium]
MDKIDEVAKKINTITEAVTFIADRMVTKSEFNRLEKKVDDGFMAV